jgi:hypothetical protein
MKKLIILICISLFLILPSSVRATNNPIDNGYILVNGEYIKVIKEYFTSKVFRYMPKQQDMLRLGTYIAPETM